MPPLRFSLRTLLSVIAIIAIAFYSYREYQRHLERERLREIRAGFLRWTEATNRSDGKIHSYFNLDRALDRGAEAPSTTKPAFLVSNTQMTLRPEQTPQLVFDPFTREPDPTRFYVLPSEKWVDTAGDVILEWDAWHRTKY